MKMYRIGLEGGRPAAGLRRRVAGMVLQGHRHDPPRRTASRSTSRRTATTAATKPRSPACYVVGDDGRPVPRRPRAGQRVLRPRAGGEELPLPRAVEAAQLLDRSGAGHRRRLLRRASARPAWSGPVRSSGKAPRPAASGGCATRWRTSNTTTSSTPSTAAPATPTSISSAPTCSASRTACGSKTATRWSIAFEGFGRPLRNPIRIARETQPFVEVRRNCDVARRR